MLKPHVVKSAFAFLLLSAAPVATAQAPVHEAAAPARQWALTASDQGCMAYAGTSAGTTVSISATPAQDALLFVVQNPGWQSLEDGAAYPLSLEFDAMGPWAIEATARSNIDADGPGLIFVVRPGREDGARFMDEFAGASALKVGHDGATLDNVSLVGSGSAMSGMAQCIGQMWTAAVGAPEAEALETEEAPLFPSEEPAVGI